MFKAAHMALDIERREREGVAILELKGRITAGDEATSLRQSVEALEQSGSRNIVLDMAGVDYVDSTGLGALVICAIGLQERGGHIKLLSLNRRNVELLVLTKLATVFEIFKTEQDAVNSFYPGRETQTFDILEFVHNLQDGEAAESAVKPKKRPGRGNSGMGRP